MRRLLLGTSLAVAAGCALAAHSGSLDKTAVPAKALAGGPGATYQQFALDNGSRAHVVRFDINNHQWRLRPFIQTEGTLPTSLQTKQRGGVAGTNGGYFNLKEGGLSTSYVVSDGKLVADPTKNALLMDNPKLKAFLPQILNRSELRIVQNGKASYSIEIARHLDPLRAGCRLVDALQGGPRLLPEVDAEAEGFVRKNADGSTSDSIGVNKAAARTAFGITADRHAILLCVAGSGQDPESCGITLADLRALLKQLGCVEALNLDGGASTSMYVHLAGQPLGAVVCAKRPETHVKSVLILQPAGQKP
jgi:hypothetical protein